MKTLTYLLLASIIAVTTTFAKPPGTIFAKNGGSSIMHVWINGYYLGYIRPGETRYSVSDGFIAPDSGNGRDNKPVKESHGGWDHYNRESATIKFQFENDKPNSLEATANEKGEIWFGGTNGIEPPPIPSELDAEGSQAIIKGSKPSEGVTAGVAKGTTKGSAPWKMPTGQWSGKGLSWGGNFRYQLSEDQKLQIIPYNWPKGWVNAGVVSAVEKVSWESFFKMENRQQNTEAIVRDLAKKLGIEQVSNLPTLYKITLKDETAFAARLFQVEETVFYYDFNENEFYELKKVK